MNMIPSSLNLAANLSNMRSRLFSMVYIENTDLYLLINAIMNDSSRINNPLDLELNKIFKL